MLFKKTVFLLFLQRDFNYARRASKKLLLKFFFFFNCGIIALQCCIGFCCKNKVNQLCTCAQSCPTLCEPMDCSPTGSSVHGIFQARILEWVSISFSRESSQPRNWNCISCWQVDQLYLYIYPLSLSLSPTPLPPNSTRSFQRTKLSPLYNTAASHYLPVLCMVH